MDNGDGTCTYTSPVTSVTSPTGDDRGHIALLGGAGVHIALRARSLKRQLRG
ncbi:hypothetical protein BCUN_1753 [Bifidobacterium cuniculi]|uniref:Uncharacterized protein n=1 Tax=Bifidobacterium cuniculi TaxID=1688 RepID=A0A087AIH5_9BIFI|nr:hypothetical protein BCUN_1753 [Bifidobacterium cuniculi]